MSPQLKKNLILPQPIQTRTSPKPQSAVAPKTVTSGSEILTFSPATVRDSSHAENKRLFGVAGEDVRSRDDRRHRVAVGSKRVRTARASLVTRVSRRYRRRRKRRGAEGRREGEGHTRRARGAHVRGLLAARLLSTAVRNIY